MEDLGSILQRVAQKKIGVNQAIFLLKKNYLVKSRMTFPFLRKLQQKKRQTATEQKKYAQQKTKFKPFGKKRVMDSLRKIPDYLARHISVHLPQMDKIQEVFVQQFNNFTFIPSNHGLEAKFSVFRALQISPDCSVTHNQIVGSQWLHVQFLENTVFNHNRFTAVQFSEVTVICSDFCSSQLGLTRFGNVTLQESKLENNKISRSTFSDVNLTESDFIENHIVKSDISETIINASRLTKCALGGVTLHECEFDSCDIQGLEIENCKFHECTFQRVYFVLPERYKISNEVFVGKQIVDVNDFETFLLLLRS